MAGKNVAKPSSAKSREERLKAALKANLGRRKAQAKERAKEREIGTEDKEQDNG